MDFPNYYLFPELNKEDLISSLLIPSLQPKVSSSVHCTFHSKPAATSDNGHTSDSIFLGTCASNRSFDAGGRLSTVPTCLINEKELERRYALDEPPQLGPPHDQTSARTSDTYFEPGLSRRRIQRSRSRQNAPELCNTAKRKPERCSSKEGSHGVYSGRVTRSRTASQQSDSVNKFLELKKTSDVADDIGSGVANAKKKCQHGGDDKSVHSLQLNLNKDMFRNSSSSILQFYYPEGFTEVNGSKDLSNKGTWFRSVCNNGPSQIAKMLNRNEGKYLKEARDAQDDILLHSDGSEIVNQEKRNCGIAETEIVSNGPAEACPILQHNFAGGFLQSDNSSKVATDRNSRSKCASLNKPCQHVEALKCIEGDSLQKASEAQASIVRCKDFPGIINEENRVVGVEHVSSDPVQPCCIHSQSNILGASHREGLELLPSVSGSFFEPKQLVFDDVDVSSLNEGVYLMGMEAQGKSLEIRSFSLSVPAESVEKVDTTLSESIRTRKSIILEKTEKSSIECSRPKSKRRKVEVRSTTSFTASGRLMRGKLLQEVQEETDSSSFLEIVENGVKAVPEIPHLHPHEVSVAQSNFLTGSESSNVEMPFQKVECLESPTEFQVDEGELVPEMRNKSAESALTCNNQQVEASLEGHGSLPHFLGGSLLTKYVDLIGADQTMPEFEGFSIGEDDLSCVAKNDINFDPSSLLSTSIGQIITLEQLYRSSRMLTPLPLASTKYKLHKTPDIYQSLPNGLLEHMDTRSSMLFNANESKQVRCSYNGTSEEVFHPFLGRSYPDCMSSFSVGLDWDIRRPPCTPPVGKLCQKNTSKASNGGFEKRESINPELTCFRIEEDPSFCEENEDEDEMVDPVQKRHQPRGDCLAIREPLADVANESLNPSASVSLADNFVERGSLESVNAGFNVTQPQMGSIKKLKSCFGSLQKYKNKNKENQGASLGGRAAWKATRSLKNRFSKPKLSGKGGQSLLRKGYKGKSVVSNISSFIPFIEQKLPAGDFKGKRDIKVKALDAAEAAKCCEAKRENERKMKKEAMKLERARLEQEHMKQLELNQKKKEEEWKWKKKHADLDARKRLREEDERKDKGKKRKCIEEARRRQKKHEEQLQLEKGGKEIGRQAADERKQKGNTQASEAIKLRKMGRGRAESDSRKKTNIEPTALVSECHSRKACDFHQVCQAPKESSKIEKEIWNPYKAHEDVVSVNNGSLEQSYAISPYQDSDGEEEDEEDFSNQKFIPSWVSSSASKATAVIGGSFFKLESLPALQLHGQECYSGGDCLYVQIKSYAGICLNGPPSQRYLFSEICSDKVMVDLMTGFPNLDKFYLMGIIKFAC